MKKTSLIATAFLFMFVAFQNCSYKTAPDRAAQAKESKPQPSEVASSVLQAPQNHSMQASPSSIPQ